MSDKTVIGVDPVNGRSKLVYVDHAGPKSYTTGGESWPQQSSLGGPNAVGLNDVAWCNGGYTEDGLYLVVPVFGGQASLKGTIKLKWFAITGASGGTFTGTPATLTGTNSAPTITTSSGGVTTALGVAAGALSEVTGATGITGVQAPVLTMNAYTPAGTITGVTGGSLAEVAASTDLSGSYLRLAVLGG